MAVDEVKVGDGQVVLRGLERDGELGETWLCGVVGVERTIFEVELLDEFITVAILGDDAQPNVGELGYKGAGNAASGVGVIDPWDGVPKDGERGSERGWGKSCGCV